MPMAGVEGVPEASNDRDLQRLTSPKGTIGHQRQSSQLANPTGPDAEERRDQRPLNGAVSLRARLEPLQPIPARHIDKHTRDFWIAEGFITISGIWPFKKAHLTEKALNEGLPNGNIGDLLFDRGPKWRRGARSGS